ncbi:hypothetical protein KFL_008740035 [Klebsormidium nitens]|uniref:Uncharacterized protein n=1 Tax=Klebsormidium nitens TaxID=105231 RepID=A0A1Y1IRL2_KLENI|nr:hypothetical protein KFL_008740035 [Klebsormidium nitens]|eukprot:GAQ91881.1 hypothetical protein KFL_008740035 [Klebsormidium nitens]
MLLAAILGRRARTGRVGLPNGAPLAVLHAAETGGGAAPPCGPDYCQPAARRLPPNDLAGFASGLQSFTQHLKVLDHFVGGVPTLSVLLPRLPLPQGFSVGPEFYRG